MATSGKTLWVGFRNEVEPVTCNIAVGIVAVTRVEAVPLIAALPARSCALTWQ